MSVFEPLKPFRFWCQKVLPLVYDDTLSYYELLCKVVDYLNNTMQDVNTLGDAFQTLQTYVNNYFSSLDVQEEINNKLDQMAESGALSVLLQPIVSDEVSAWLEEHITPTTPSVDSSLTVSGAAADSKVVGMFRQAAINTVGSLNMMDGVQFTEGYMINDNGETEASTAGYAYTDLIPVDNAFYDFTWSLVQNSSLTQIHGYDSTGTWIKSLKKDSRSTVGTYKENINCIGISYIRISIRKINVADLFLNRADNLQIQADKNNENILRLSSMFNQALLNGLNIFDFPEIDYQTDKIVISGNYGNDTANLSNYSATDLIPISRGLMLRNSAAVGSTSHKINFYDSHGVLIESHNNTFDNALLIAPDESAFVRFDVKSDNAAGCFLSSREFDEVLLNSGIIPAAAFGYTPAAGINSSGGAVANVGGATCITNYLPVRPGSKIILPYSINSTSWHLAVYSADKTVLNVYPMNKATSESIIEIPQTGAFIRFTGLTSEINKVYYLYYPENMPITNINAVLLGAKANGVDDDTEALQRCCNIGGYYHIPVYLPSGTYLITGAVNINYQNTAILGVPWGEYAGSRIIVKAYAQTVEGSTIIYPTNEDGSQVEESVVPDSAFLVKRAGVIIKDVVFTLNNASILQSDKNNLVVDGIHFILGRADNANVDGEINHCLFTGLNNAILIAGRNLKVTNCLFSHVNTGVKMNWQQRFAYEQRGVVISENRFHSVGRNNYGLDHAYDLSKSCVKFPDYVAADDIRLNVVRNNYADFCGTFFSGDAHGLELKNNSIYLSRGALVNSTAKNISATNGTTLNFATMFPEGLPATQSGIDIWSLSVVNRSGLYLTSLIPVTGGGAVKLNYDFATNVWGHGFYNEQGELIDAIIASKQGTYIIPDDAAYMRFTATAAIASSVSVTLYDTYTTETASTIESSYAEQQITICDNAVCGAVKTDYTPGLNIMTNAIFIKGYSGIVIKNNVFTNGTSDVIDAELCKKILFNGNCMNAAPRFCEVYDSSGDLTVVEATNKNFIKMVDVDDYKIIYNSAINGLKYNGSDQSYVSVPVTLDGDAVDVSAKNDF